jgi:hypothetical protein
MAEINSREVSLNRLQDAARQYGLQKRLALDMAMTDSEVSRLLHDQAPKVINLMAQLGLEVVSSEYVESLRRILKETL